jgi:peptide/nickel transport system permease protein
MGTDSLGRDMLSRVIASIPIDASLSLVVIAASLLIGIILGSIAGYFGGIIDEVIMRLTDIILAFPGIVLTLAIASALGASLINMAIALILVWWSPYVRIARGVTLSVKENQYIEAARASGLGSLTIIRRHIIPNILSPMLVYASLDIGYIILTASVLSYLGVGVQPPQAEWGRMVFEMQSYLFSQWWLPIFPGLAITITVLGFNLLGDALRDILDPRTRKIVGG